MVRMPSGLGTLDPAAPVQTLSVPCDYVMLSNRTIKSSDPIGSSLANRFQRRSRSLEYEDTRSSIVLPQRVLDLGMELGVERYHRGEACMPEAIGSRELRDV